MGRRKRHHRSAPPMMDVSPIQRVSLILINLALMVFSGLVLATSTYSLIERWDDLHWIESSVVVNLIVHLEIPFLTTSFIVFGIATLGYIGSLRENRTLLWHYSCSLSILQYTVLAFAAFIFVAPLFTKKSIENVISIDLIVNYRDNADYQGLVDYIQAAFECCGVSDKSYRDWNNNIYFNCSKTNPSFERCSVPASCCKPQDTDNEVTAIVTSTGGRYCGQGVLDMPELQAWNLVYTRSCPSAMVGKARAYGIYIVGGCVVAVILLVILAYMADHVREEIKQLTKVYERYYEDIRRGVRKKLAKRRALARVPRGCVVVRQQHDKQDTSSSSSDEGPPDQYQQDPRMIRPVASAVPANQPYGSPYVHPKRMGRLDRLQPVYRQYR
ncbi:tetraspanin-33-like [Ornithodoros turicata]|uniref:tetraspanin-33-like n=1 Tax=Ornithodoros turicata TaxID=34597 RepID=UPI00313A2F7B